MESTFMSYLLLLCITFILFLYFNQTQNKVIKNQTMKTTHSTNTMQNNSISQFYTNTNTNTNTNLDNSYSGMPIHRIGPIYNFHQSFSNPTCCNDINHINDINALGWRTLYMNNYSKNEVKYEDPFASLITRNYLDNMDSVDNIYRKHF